MTLSFLLVSTLAMEPLPYDAAALEPVISKQTIDYHYGKHYAAYVSNTNKLAQGTIFENVPLTHLLRSAQPGPLLNNAGQVYNHALYFLQFMPGPKRNVPEGPLAKAIDRSFGSFDAMQKEINLSATTLFGSGWTWLYTDAAGNLYIGQFGNGDNPLIHGYVPLLGFDVWEHAYYLDYQNRRAEHIQALWSIINWCEVECRYMTR